MSLDYYKATSTWRLGSGLTGAYRRGNDFLTLDTTPPTEVGFVGFMIDFGPSLNVNIYASQTRPRSLAVFRATSGPALLEALNQ